MHGTGSHAWIRVGPSLRVSCASISKGNGRVLTVGELKRAVSETRAVQLCVIS